MKSGAHRAEYAKHSMYRITYMGIFLEIVDCRGLCHAGEGGRLADNFDNDIAVLLNYTVKRQN